MPAVIGFLLLVAVAIFILLLAAEPASSEQQAAQVKGDIERQTEQAMAEIDAATDAHKKQVFELVADANRRMVEEQAAQARQQVQRTMKNIAKE